MKMPYLLALALSLGSPFLYAKNQLAGELMIVGGALASSNHAVYQQFIQSAGGKEKARIVVIPAASIGTRRPRKTNTTPMTSMIESRSVLCMSSRLARIVAVHQPVDAGQVAAPCAFGDRIEIEVGRGVAGGNGNGVGSGAREVSLLIPFTQSAFPLFLCCSA